MNPEAALPHGSTQALDFVMSKVFKKDATKIAAADKQFNNYWTETGDFYFICEKLRSDAQRALEQDTTSAELLAKMNPLEKCLHKLKLLPKYTEVINFFNTRVISEAPELCYLLECVSSITAGCVRVERSVKVQKMIHRKVRNRLLHEKVNKLVQVYLNARLGMNMGYNVTSLEDMLDLDNDENMEQLLEEAVDWAVQQDMESDVPPTVPATTTAGVTAATGASDDAAVGNSALTNTTEV